ncbi:MAG: right-handed parallel beta-helix repeat-containing protein [Novosphingobium sp.]
MTKLAALPLAAIALAFSVISSQAQDGAAYTVVESGRQFSRLQDAVSAIGGGTGTIRVASGVHQDCAVQTAGQIAYVAGAPGQAIFDGVTCEGKAALVLRGTSASVEGLVFTHMRVPDFNGAGIRLEHGDLTVTQSWFRDSQQGILTGPDPDGRITVDKSTFTRLGTCEGAGGCAHSIYVGDYGSTKVTRSRFEAGRGGHYLKSRAAHIDIEECSFDDSAGHQTNYMIDLPGGATGRIAGNWFVQGSNKENHSAFIALGAEGKANSSAGLVIEDNDARFAPNVPWPSVFVADWSGDPIQIGRNKLDPKLTVKERR